MDCRSALTTKEDTLDASGACFVIESIRFGLRLDVIIDGRLRNTTGLQCLILRYVHGLDFLNFVHILLQLAAISVCSLR